MASTEAGGIEVTTMVASLLLENSTISGNRTDGYGGGVITRVPLVIRSCTIVGNDAGTSSPSAGRGGGLFAYRCSKIGWSRIGSTALALESVRSPSLCGDTTS